MQLITLNSVGSLSAAGLGMQMFAAFQYYLLNDPFGFEPSLNFCNVGSYCCRNDNFGDKFIIINKFSKNLGQRDVCHGSINLRLRPVTTS